MTCNSSELLFEAYLDATLVPAKRAALVAHLRACGRCAGVLAELRAVDALLAGPREVSLPENFTFATMAEVRSMPRPQVSPAPLVAYLVSYLTAAWLLTAAAFLLARPAMRAFGETALDASAQFARTAGALLHAGSRMAGDLGSLATVLGGALVLDSMLLVALVVGVRTLRPRVTERLRL